MILILWLHVGWGFSGRGDVLRYSAGGTVGIKKSKPSNEEKVAALEAAKRAILARVIADQDATRRQRLGEIIGSLLPDEYFVVGSLLVSETRVDDKARIMTVVAQAEVDTDRFNKVLDGGKPSPSQYIAWVFAARRQASVKEYEPEAFHRATQEERSERSAAATATGGKAEALESEAKQTTTASSAGVRRRSDSIEYVVAEEQRARIDKALSSVLVSRGLRPVPASDLQANSNGKLRIPAVMEDFKASSDISDENKALVMEAALAAEVDLFATGTVTINAKSRDPTTGKTRIAATVDAQVFGFRKSRKGDRFVGSAVVASTGSKVVVAIGNDQSEAENKAIEEASVIAGNILCDQLRSP